MAKKNQNWLCLFSKELKKKTRRKNFKEINQMCSNSFIFILAEFCFAWEKPKQSLNGQGMKQNRILGNDLFLF